MSCDPTPPDNLRRHLLLSSAAGLFAPLAAAAGSTAAAVPPLLWPGDLLPAVTCGSGGVTAVRAALFGVQRYRAPLSDLAGTENDVTLMAATLRRLGVAHLSVDAGEVPRQRFVSRLHDLARESRCGDTVLVHFSGSSFADEHVGGGQFLLPFSDLDLGAGKAPQLAPFPLGLSSRVDARPVLDGAVFAGDLSVYVDRLRLRGVNVVLVVDGCDGSRLAGQGLATPDPTVSASAWSWRPWLDDSRLAPELPVAIGACFLLLAPEDAAELSLPPGAAESRIYGAFTFALAASLLELGTDASFETLARRVSKLHDGHLVSQGRPTSGGWRGPAFETSHPQRAMLAVGVPDRGRGRVALQALHDRSFTIRAPRLQGGLARVSAETVTVEGRVEAPSSPAAVWINGTPGVLRSGGEFKVSLPVRRGENPLQLVAYWPTGDLALQHFTVLSAPRDRLVLEGRRLVLLIGVKDYADARFGPLTTPLNDVREVGALLRRRFGYVTALRGADGSERSLLLENPTREQILRALSLLRRELGDADSLIIYFAGHGLYESETDQAHWLPSDAEDGEPSSWLAAADLRAAVQRLRARHVLVVADSCFSGALRSPAGGGDEPPTDRLQFLDQVALRPSRMVMTSGSNEPVIDTGGRGHSVFARALMQALSDQREPVTARELFFRQVLPAVRARASQTPQMFPMREGHGGGELVLLPSV